MKLNICFGIFLVIGIVLCGIALVPKFLVFPKIINDRIEEFVILKNGTEAYDRWETLPLPITYQSYFFNITNAEDVSRGGKPIFQEVGPYIYKQYRSKFNITEQGDTLSYREHVIYEFDANASHPLTDLDVIHVVNLPLVAMIDMAERQVRPLLKFMDRVIPKVFNNPKHLFLLTTPRDFLFDGVFLQCQSNDIVIRVACAIIEKLAPRTIVRQTDGNFKFSLFNYKNDTDEGTFVVNSGKSNVKSLGQLSSWNGSNTTNLWQTNGSCNEIFGSDGTIHPPFETTHSVLDIFTTDLCRTVPLEYSQAINYNGVDGFRFTAKKSTFLSPKIQPQNQCYCLNKTYGILGQDECLLDGALELTTCHGAPVVFTYPHFYLTHATYQAGVDGLKPDSLKHENYLDILPEIGIPLRGSKRGQLDIFFRPVSNVSLTFQLNTTLMPIMWFDEGVGLTDHWINELNTQYLDKLRILDIIVWTAVGFGVAIFITSIIVFLCCRKARSSKKH